MFVSNRLTWLVYTTTTTVCAVWCSGAAGVVCCLAGGAWATLEPSLKQKKEDLLSFLAQDVVLVFQLFTKEPISVQRLPTLETVCTLLCRDCARYSVVGPFKRPCKIHSASNLSEIITSTRDRPTWWTNNLDHPSPFWILLNYDEANSTEQTPSSISTRHKVIYCVDLQFWFDIWWWEQQTPTRHLTQLKRSSRGLSLYNSVESVNGHIREGTLWRRYPFLVLGAAFPLPVDIRHRRRKGHSSAGNNFETVKLTHTEHQGRSTTISHWTSFVFLPSWLFVCFPASQTSPFVISYLPCLAGREVDASKS
jgi:hypothetical protein